MLKDLLGEILKDKKQKAMTVTINIEPSKETPEEEMDAAGMAPMLKEEESEEKDEKEIDETALLNGEEDEIKGKLKKGLAPRGLAERAKMNLLDK